MQRFRTTAGLKQKKIDVRNFLKNRNYYEFFLQKAQKGYLEGPVN